MAERSERGGLTQTSLQGCLCLTIKSVCRYLLLDFRASSHFNQTPAEISQQKIFYLVIQVHRVLQTISD